MISLTSEEVDFMLVKLSLSPRLRAELERLREASSRTVSDATADELRDLCADRLDTHGFDASYEPTKEGEFLEALIDKLFSG